MPACNGSDRGCDITPRESEPTSPGCRRTGTGSQPARGAKQIMSRAATPVVRPPPNFGSWLCRSTVQVDPKANGAAASP